MREEGVLNHWFKGMVGGDGGWEAPCIDKKRTTRNSGW